MLSGIRFSWTDVEDGMLGKYPDAVVADFIGVTPLAVLKRRQKLGINAWGGRRHHLQRCSNSSNKNIRKDYPKYKRRIRSKNTINWSKVDKLLGTMYDNDLADKYHVSQSMINRRRRKLGILSYMNKH